MTKDNNHWYDGWFYDIFVAPSQDIMFAEIKQFIEPASRIIDVGCGTGRFSFSTADKCEYILGIDLSVKNIDKANDNLSKNLVPNISFLHSGVDELISNPENHFDYAVMTYVIHEVDESERINLLNDIMQIADKIIIGDYLIPLQAGFPKWMTNSVEFFAGREHYRNFKNYEKNGGIYYLAKKAGLKIDFEVQNRLRSNHLVVLTK